MLKNYFKIAWRNLLRNKLRTGIHILGLSLGISICFLIFNVVWHAYSFDNFHPDRDRIFRITTVNDYGEMSYSFPAAPGPLGEVLDQELAGVESAGRLYTIPETHASLPALQKNFGRKDYIAFADPGFFTLFERNWLAGNPKAALTAPNQVVITQKSAETYFPGEAWDSLLGKEILYVDTDSIFTSVVGVVEDYRENSDFIFQDFISYSTIKENDKEDWYGIHSWNNINSSNQLFFKTQTGYDTEEIESGLEKIAAKYYSDEEDGKTSFGVEPLSELHFTYPFENEGASKTLIQGLLIIGGIILVLACLNFINLETAQAIGRAKEVGIRKTLGGERNQIVFQFLIETYLLVLLSTLVGLVLSDLLSKSFQEYLPAGFSVDYLAWYNLSFLLGFTFLLTVISGLYPAFILANYQPQRALKGEKQASGKFSFGVFLRKNLTIIQFSASMVFLILVLVIGAQLKFIQSQPVGFEKEAVVFARLPFMAGIEKASQYKERTAQMSFVSGASLAGDAISSSGIWTSDVKVPVDTSLVEFFTQVKNVDSAFVAVNGVELVVGRNLGSNEKEVLVNEEFIRESGFQSPNEALGASIDFRQDPHTIVGVMKDFNSRSLHEEIMPMIFFQEPDYFNVISFKLEKGINLASALESLKESFEQVYPYEEVNFVFLDQEMEKFYQNDNRIRTILGFSSLLAILISAMGLFGLSSYTIAQRTKEISIRKILGASMGQILGLISKEYIVLVLISFLIAVFPAYYFLRDWLNEFSYRIDMPYLLFGLAGLGVMAVCLVIVGIHSLVALTANPAQVLKDE